MTLGINNVASQGGWEDEFPLPQAGYDSSLQGMLTRLQQNNLTRWAPTSKGYNSSYPVISYVRPFIGVIYLTYN